MAVLSPAWLCRHRDRALKGESSGHLKKPPLVGGQNRIRICCRFHLGEAIRQIVHEFGSPFYPYNPHGIPIELPS